jgi:hypothetical protein
MYDNDEMTDDVLRAVRDSVCEVPMPAPPPLAAIVSRGRARRHRRLSKAAAAGVAIAIVVSLAIVLPTLSGSGNAPLARSATLPKLGSGPVHVRLEAFSVNSNPDGTVTVTVTDEQTVDPNAFRQILAQAGVPALIDVGSFCHTPDQPPGLDQVIQMELGQNVMVITPSAMPAGAELSIGYFPDHVAFTLVTVGASLTCVTSDPPSQPLPPETRITPLPSVP